MAIASISPSKVDVSGEAPCWVAKGPCGHYYYCAVVDPRVPTGRDLAAIRRRKGHVIEVKTVQFVRDGGLDYDEDCRFGMCAMRPAAKVNAALARSEAHAEVVEKKS